MEERVNKTEKKLNKTEEKLHNVNADVKAERDKNRRLEYEMKNLQTQQEYQLQNQLQNCMEIQTKQFVEYLEAIKKNFLPKNQEFDRFVKNFPGKLGGKVDEIGLHDDKKSNLLDRIMVAAKEAFPGQSDDNLLTMIMEIKREHGGLKSLTMNSLIMKMRDLVNSNLDEECTICLEPMDRKIDVMKLKCKHEFHLDCIHEYFKIKMECPLCRRYEVLDDEYPSLGAPLTRNLRRESAGSSINSA